MSSIWKDTRNSNFKVTSADSFINEQSVPQEIRDSYKQFIKKFEENPALFDSYPVKANGFRDFDWEGIDDQWQRRYTVTHNPQYGFGVMRGPKPQASKKQSASPAPGQQTLNETVDLSGLIKVIEAQNKKFDTLIEQMETLIGILGGPKPVVGAA